MAKCMNCAATLSCGCQKRTASDGKSCCSSCITTYEKKLKTVQHVSQPQQIPMKKNPPKFGF